MIGSAAPYAELAVTAFEAIRIELDDGGLVLRYTAVDGLAGGEGAFLACSFRPAECVARQGRDLEARELFDRADACSNDLGLFAEEYSCASGKRRLPVHPSGDRRPH